MSGVERLEDLVASGKSIDLDALQEALRDSRAWWDVVFEAAGLAILLGDVTGNVLATTPSFEAIFGYTEEELKALGIPAITHPDDLRSDLEHFMELVQGERDSYQLEKRYIRKDGSQMWGRLTVMLLRDSAAEPKFVIAMVTDITESKEAEELRRAEQSAHELQKQAIELNDTIVQGLVAAKMALELEQREHAHVVVGSTLERAQDVVANLLATAEKGKELAPGDLTRERPAIVDP